jgi:hypothetical protein
MENWGIEMNRRSFVSDMLRAGVAAMFLPSALTYRRTWQPVESGMWIPNLAWSDAPFEIKTFSSEEMAWLLRSSIIRNVNRAAITNLFEHEPPLNLPMGTA